MARPGSLGLEGSDRPQLTKGGKNSQFSISRGVSNSISPGPVKPVRLCVYTMKDELKFDERFDSGRLTTTKQVLDRALPKLGIAQPNRRMFGLWLKSKHLQFQLKSYHLPFKVFKRWKDLLSQYTSVCYEDVCGDEPLLILQRNAYLSTREEKQLLEFSPDPVTIDLLYHQAVHNVTQSPYAVASREELDVFAGIQGAVSQAELSREPILDKSNFGLFYPSWVTGENQSKIGQLFSSKFSANLKEIQPQFMAKLRSAYSDCSDALKLKQSYLMKCWSHSMYGAVLFTGQIKRPSKLFKSSDRPVFVGINRECVHILSTTSPPEVLLHEPLDKLCWEFQACEKEGEDYYSSLWLEYETMEPANQAGGTGRKVFKLLQVFSRQAPMMDAMLEQSWKYFQQQPPAAATAEGAKQVHTLKPEKLLCDEYDENGMCLRSSAQASLSLLRRKNRRSRSRSPVSGDVALQEIQTTTDTAPKAELLTHKV